MGKKMAGKMYKMDEKSMPMKMAKKKAVKKVAKKAAKKK